MIKLFDSISEHLFTCPSLVEVDLILRAGYKGGTIPSVSEEWELARTRSALASVMKSMLSHREKKRERVGSTSIWDGVSLGW